MNVRLQYAINFTAGIFYDGHLQMNNYISKIYMLTNTPDSAANNIAFERIKYFVYNQLDSSIFINSENEEQCQKYVDAGLSITTFPGDPVDQLVGIMLYYKLKAITEEQMIIGEVEISSGLGDGLIYIHGESETTDELIPPQWWNSADLVHCDSTLIETDKIVSMHQSSVWRELDLAWPDIENDEPDNEPETGNTVVFADFKKLNDTE